ncbi:metallophosphoesterase (plasmid) [Roseobacteraceae bacterium NS-SX3]
MPFPALTTDWQPLPEPSEVPEHLFVIADVHGQAGLLAALLEHLTHVPGLSGWPRVLVFTGDLIDRGPSSLEVLRLALAAEGRFGRCILLPGNHEQMLAEALAEPHAPAALRFWAANGGTAVIREVLGGAPCPAAQIPARVRAALPEGFLRRILSAPSHYICGDLLMVHAGLDPLADRAAFLAQPLLGSRSAQHWAWIRTPFLRWTGGWDPPGAPRRTLVAHGHTVELRAPVTSAAELLRGLCRLRRHRRFSLDAGSVLFGHLAALEARGRVFRLHLMRETPGGT